MTDHSIPATAIGAVGVIEEKRALACEAKPDDISVFARALGQEAEQVAAKVRQIA